MDKFNLHKDFSNEIFLKNLELSSLFLRPFNEFHWFLLIPKVNNAKNILDLNKDRRKIFWQEIEFISEIIKKIHNPEQLNIAMLGNITPQLHCHIIARYNNDPAWPNPVFGFKTTKASNEKISEIKERILSELE